MRRRTFALADSAHALLYITQLLGHGISFTVEPRADRVDITTPFELEPADFPDARWLKQ